jgi:drug/metabolite transporter (DMT)-like permease
MRHFYEHLNDLLIPDFRFGIILCTLSTISWAFGSLYTKKKGVPLILILVWNSNGTFSILLLTITETTGMAVPLSTVPAASWWSIAYCIIGSIISFIAYIYMLQKYHQK